MCACVRGGGGGVVATYDGIQLQHLSRDHRVGLEYQDIVPKNWQWIDRNLDSENKS